MYYCFGITTGDNYTVYQNLFSYEYYVMSRFIRRGYDQTNFPIKVPFNDFIVGGLQELNFNDEYLVDVDVKYEGIEIEFKSESATMSISWNNVDSSCKIQPSSTIQLLRLLPGRTCGGNSLPYDLKDLRFTIVVSTTEFDKGTFSPYHFRVRPYYGRYHYINVNSDKEIACKIDEGKCNMLVSLYSYDDVSKFLIYANTPGKMMLNFIQK